MSPARYPGVKGVEDILPPDTYLLQEMEAAMREAFSLYGFKELRIPVIEFTDVFTRSIGETSDIVEKEMYTFLDRAGRSITLRPEGTASVVRCYVEKHLYNLPAPQKFFYSGPMFRYERPQKGRQRQFYQIGAEAFGVEEPKMDAEVISMLVMFLKGIGLEGFRVELNSIGCKNCRPAYREALRGAFAPGLGSLCPDCQRRYELNPLRILDCKVDKCRELRKGAPLVTDSLCPECREHFRELKSLLDMLGIRYELNPEMVRGLDYYSRTTFEVTSDRLGSQSAVAAGGRYDGLVEEFGGPATPAIGFAIGVERLIYLLKERELDIPLPDVFIAAIGPAANREAVRLAGRLRAEGAWVELGYGGASLKSQMRRADRLGAAYAFIIGDDELGAGVFKWKSLKDGSAGEISGADAPGFIKSRKNRL
ncbi:MAG: histidine--tRNA ligase [Thermodesulfovibrionales bacterium]|nr:histidine--tRNA ligase [Thermodesulfovibrionales bacterium]